MSDQDLNQLEERYFLIKKGKVWQLIGGLIGVFVIVGLISWQSTLQTLKDVKTKEVIAQINKDVKEGSRLLEGIRRVNAKAVEESTNLHAIIDDRFIDMALRLATNQMGIISDRDAILKEKLLDYRKQYGKNNTEDAIQLAVIRSYQDGIKSSLDLLVQLEIDLMQKRGKPPSNPEHSP